MPWHVPEDLAHFKELTLGDTVVMGRKTWDALDPRFRPLPGRRNIVVTRDPEWSADGAEVVHSLDDALAAPTPSGSSAAPSSSPRRSTAPTGSRSPSSTSTSRATPSPRRSAPDGGSPPRATWQQSRSGIRYRFLPTPACAEPALAPTAARLSHASPANAMACPRHAFGFARYAYCASRTPRGT